AGAGPHVRGRAGVRALSRGHGGEATAAGDARARQGKAQGPAVLRLHAEWLWQDGHRALFAARRGRCARLHSAQVERGARGTRSETVQPADRARALEGSRRSVRAGAAAGDPPAAVQTMTIVTAPADGPR